MTYSGTFLSAVKSVLKHEGGFVNDPADPGGATKYGVSLRYLTAQGIIFPDINKDGYVDWRDISALTFEDAINIYHEDWWEKNSYDSLPAGVDAKVLDMSVNMGAKQAHRLLQRAVPCCDGGARLAEDGVLGPQTRLAIMAVPTGQLIAALRAVQGAYYHSLVANRPALEKFLPGWMNRAYF